jgi:hypothetical protein
MYTGTGSSSTSKLVTHCTLPVAHTEAPRPGQAMVWPALNLSQISKFEGDHQIELPVLSKRIEKNRGFRPEIKRIV